MADDRHDRRDEGQHVRQRALVLLHEARGHLRGRALKLIGFLVFAYLFLKLVPGLEKSLESLKNVHLEWVVAALAVETLSEVGYVVSWRGIIDPENLLGRIEGSRHVAAETAWSQLGGGMLVPGGTIGSIGVGAWMLHRLGMSMEGVAKRQFTLMFLNTGVDALAIVFFGTGLAVGLFSGESNLLLTLLPAAIVAILLLLALYVAHHTDSVGRKLHGRRAKIASAIRTLADAVEGVEGILRGRGSVKIILGALAYLLFDMAVLYGAFHAIDTHPMPSFAIVAMGYLLGSLGGSLPLPASLGSIGGMSGMLIVYGVSSHDALAAVVLYQAIGYLVPLIGGGIAYLFLRRRFGPVAHVPDDRSAASAAHAPGEGEQVTTR
jgi:uncharacterized membrane protein YbhN (UPF0104 family)